MTAGGMHTRKDIRSPPAGSSTAKGAKHAKKNKKNLRALCVLSGSIFYA